MTFRDDHDAALARADALDGELKRAQAERDALKAELANRAAGPPKASEGPRRRSPIPGTVERMKPRTLAIVVFLVIAGAAAFFVPAIMRRGSKNAAWKAAMDARQHQREHWQQLISVEPCVRDVSLDTVGPVSRRKPDVFDPRRDSDNVGYDLGRVAENCVHPVREIVKDTKNWPATVREPLRAWADLETEVTAAVKPLDTYLSNQDWKDDDYKGGREMWAKLLAVLARRDAAIAEVRKTVLPVLRAEIKQLQAKHGTKDEVWWRIELGLAKWEADEIALDAGGVYAGRDFDTAAATPKLQAPVAALLARSAEAPIEIRRQLRKLEWITGPIVAGQVPTGETPLWHFTHPEADLMRKLRSDEKMVPAMPPDPGPPPRDNRD